MMLPVKLFLIFMLFGVTQGYYPRTLIPKRLRVKLCESNPTLTICNDLMDSPKYSPTDHYSKWDICKFRYDLPFCLHFANDKLLMRPKTTKPPMILYESSRENNGFEEPTTKVTEKYMSIPNETVTTSTLTFHTSPSSEIEGSGEIEEDEETVSVIISDENSMSTIDSKTTALPLIPIES